jgi:rhamnulokinase/L-fuculokinase
LTGVKNAEYTIASTSQMLDPFKRDWDHALLSAFGIPNNILCPISRSPSVCGPISAGICAELGIEGINVVSVGSHDTASAILAVPAAEGEDYAYLSSGTWSLLGTDIDAPIISGGNFTNEGGVGGKITFLKNITGLWLIQECKRQYRQDGDDLSYAELEAEAAAAKGVKSVIDPDAPDFMNPGDMPAKIAAYCERTSQPVPQTRGEIMRLIYESLALKYKDSLKELESVTGASYRKLHVVGGGSQSAMLCQMTADACGVPVIAGPVEATAIGNIATQLIANGVLKDSAHAREIIRNSQQPTVYEPR